MSGGFTSRRLAGLVLAVLLFSACASDSGDPNTDLAALDAGAAEVTGGADGEAGDVAIGQDDLGGDAGPDIGPDDPATEQGAPDLAEDDDPTPDTSDGAAEDAGDSGSPPEADTASGDAPAADTAVALDTAAPEVGEHGATTIRVHYDTGFGNAIAMRGAGPGLSWELDTPCEWTEGNVWVYSTTDWSADLGEVEVKPVFRGPEDELVWPAGSNYLVVPGSTADIDPFFFLESGRVELESVPSTVYGGERLVEVYLPPSYDEPGAAERSYPVLFMQDGQNLYDPAAFFGGWHLDEALDDLTTWGGLSTEAGTLEVGPIAEVIVLGPHNSPDRIVEYTPTNASFGGCNAAVQTCGGGADDYLDFLVDDVFDALRTSYRMDGPPFGIGGSSLGGLVSMYACWSRPETFDRCAVLSPSLWWDDEWMIDEVDNYDGAPRALAIYLDSGTDEGAVDTVPRLDGILRTGLGGSPVVEERVLCLLGEGHEHNELAWRARVPWGLHFLYADPQRIQPAVALPAELENCP